LSEQNKNREPLPQGTSGDYAYSTAKGLISAIPVVGGVVAELLGSVILPPMARRRDEWFETLACDLDELRTKGEIDFARLAENELFVSAVLEASNSAIRTYREEKRSALRNAVLNVATGHYSGENDVAQFFDYIDTLTAAHLRVLKYFQNPLDAYRRSGKEPNHPTIGGSPGDGLTLLMPDLGDSDALKRTVKDLFDRGLLNTDATALISTFMSPQGIFSRRTTAHGDAFVRFIEKPH